MVDNVIINSVIRAPKQVVFLYTDFSHIPETKKKRIVADLRSLRDSKSK